MLSFTDFAEKADLYTQELPAEFFEGLSGGVVLLEESKLHAKSRPGDPLYVLGEYCKYGLSRHIKLYYGSFDSVFGYMPDGQICQKLRGVIRHEFRHHMESRAGCDDLERDDERRLWGYCTEKDL